MKKTLLALLCLSTILGSCSKSTDDNSCGPVDVVAPSEEVAALQTYITSKGISAQADSRGFFFTVSQQGSDVRPTTCSSVKANYSLRLTNGTQIEANNGVSFSLRNVILGWQEGMPLIGEGGAITLYLPPSLAYGSKAQGNIPANSNLIFYVELIDVK